MRLLERSPSGKFCLTKNFDEDIPKYAILSHTWGSDDDEVNYEDLKQGTASGKAGFAKIEFCGEQAARDGLGYFWVDTCCIDKSSSTELQQSISSMFRWYRDAAKCYVYLADVSSTDSNKHDRSNGPAWVPEFCDSRWFQRGWTLQELIAPKDVIFFDLNGSRLGDKEILKQQICRKTGIPETAVLGQKPLNDFDISERYDWAKDRETKRGEDWAYCLQGIFGVCLSPDYGEGKVDAVGRLVQKIKAVSLGIEIQSLVIDAERHDQIVDPIVLDIALLETKAFFDKIRQEDENYRLNIYHNARTLTANHKKVSDMHARFFSFLRQILWSISFPGYVRAQLDQQLEKASITLRHAIDSNKKIASDLQHDSGIVQETLRKMNRVQNLIRLVIRPDGEEQLIAPSARATPQQDAEYLKLRCKFEKLNTECEELKKRLNKRNEQITTQKIKATDESEKFERTQEDANRKRQEYEKRSLWDQIWAWIQFAVFFMGS